MKQQVIKSINVTGSRTQDNAVFLRTLPLETDLYGVKSYLLFFFLRSLGSDFWHISVTHYPSKMSASYLSKIYLALAKVRTILVGFEIVNLC